MQADEVIKELARNPGVPIALAGLGAAAFATYEGKQTVRAIKEGLQDLASGTRGRYERIIDRLPAPTTPTLPSMPEKPAIEPPKATPPVTDEGIREIREKIHAQDTVNSTNPLVARAARAALNYGGTLGTPGTPSWILERWYRYFQNGGQEPFGSITSAAADDLLTNGPGALSRPAGYYGPAASTPTPSPPAPSPEPTPPAPQDFLPDAPDAEALVDKTKELYERIERELGDPAFGAGETAYKVTEEILKRWNPLSLGLNGLWGVVKFSGGAASQAPVSPFGNQGATVSYDVFKRRAEYARRISLAISRLNFREARRLKEEAVREGLW